MSRQFSTPYIVKQGVVYQLIPVANDFDENWLQNFIFTHHQAIPLNEIEPAFGPLVPVCRELPTRAGPIDMLFINPLGLPTMVECKLWKNPEARREVVGQILDYAKEISQWSYENLQDAIRKGQNVGKPSLYELASVNAENPDERDFIDNVSRNLRRGRFLLLIIGDGIRENVEQITNFLQKYAHLNFSFALVEFGVFKLPGQDDHNYFIQPRVVMQTVEIERAVFRIEDNQIKAVVPPVIGPPPPKRVKISEQVFFEKLNADDATKAGLKTLFEQVQSIGLSGIFGWHRV